jgi:ribokinase
MAGVLVVGTVNVDLVFAVDHLPQPGETVGHGTYRELGGGKGANTAAAAAASGAETHLVAAVGDDTAGRQALAELATFGVVISGVQVVEGVATGRAGIFSAPGTNSIVVAPGANEHLSADHVVEQIRTTTAAVCFASGELTDHLLDVVAGACGDHGVPLVYNASPARPLTDALMSAAPILVVNEVEAAQLTGSTDPEQATRTLAEGLTGAVLTLGADGVVALFGDRWVEVPAEEVAVIDTVGAGDAFTGAFLAAWSQRPDVAAAIAAGVRAGARAVAAPGARGWISR